MMLEHRSDFAIACVLVGAIVGCKDHAPDQVHVVAAQVSAGGDFALAVFEVDPGHTVEVGKVQPDGHRVWTSTLECDAVEALALNENIAVIRCKSGSKVDRIVTLSVSDGTRRWTHDGKAERGGRNKLRIVGDALVAYSNDAVSVLAAADGALRLSYPGPFGYGEPIIVDDHLVFTSDSKVVYVDAHTGAQSSASSNSKRGCVVGSDYVERSGNALVRRKLSELGASPTVVLEQLPAGASTLLACGTYNSDLFFEFDGISTTKTSLHILRVNRGGALVRDIEIPNATLDESHDASAQPEASRLNGMLGRFVVVPFTDSKASLTATVDLDNGTFLTKARGEVEQVLKSGNNWLLQSSSSIVAIDGATGIATATAQLHAPEGVSLSSAPQSSGRIWLFGNGWTSRARPEVAVLDLKLVPISAVNIGVSTSK